MIGRLTAAGMPEVAEKVRRLRDKQRSCVVTGGAYRQVKPLRQ